MEKYETFSTTADVGIRIQGSGYEELLQSAVKGLNLLYFDDYPFSSSASPSVYPFEFHGDSLENILVNLLAEIVFLLQNENKITIGIKFKEIDEKFLNADLLTNLKITRENNRLSTEIIFDI
jgi:SHS2 domain-containing protein